MTIKIEREALQCITNDTPPCSAPLSDEHQVDYVPDARLKVSASYPDLELTDVDDSSSVSSYSFSSSTSSDRKVTWSEPLVTEVRTRERTRQEDISSLFYSYEETQRFRQEYRLERRRSTEDDPSNDSASFKDNSCSKKPSSAWSNMNFKDNCVVPPSSLSLGRHRISRVVVMHKNVLETFVDEELTGTSSFSASHASNTGINSAMITDPTATVVADPKTASDDFFDNDSFWSGQITWY